MTNDREEQARRLAAELAALASEEREETLSRLRAEDGELFVAVEHELARAEGYFPTHIANHPTERHLSPAGMQPRGQAGGPAGGQAAPRGEVAGQVIGRYTLLQQIGSGGFGVVWMAEQRSPVVRKVALKIVKLGMDTHEVLARFESERQVLALMEHPNIAKMFDAGITATGRPYFVMELCHGKSICAYADEHRLTITERLELFSQVCLAVQHAHQKGIIHRDIKPSNVLVSEIDGKASPKIIDFGIAKVTVGSLHTPAEITLQQSFIGTPEYMSPEQANGELDIDTRTDVYALGVLLYALLTGATPFSSRELRAAAQAEMQRIIREVEPLKPSNRISRTGDTLSTLAAARRLEPAALTSLVRGELDWIVMRAMEKERTRRYDSASAFALDVRRYLTGEAVDAAPPSQAYRLRKFVRRNRGLVAATSAVALALLLGIAGFAWQAQIARDQRDLALLAREAEVKAREVADVQRDRAVAAEGEAKHRAADLKSVSDFQEQMLIRLDPSVVGATLASEVVKRYRAALEPQGFTPEQARSRVDAFAEQWQLVAAGDVARDLIDGSLLRPAVDALDRQFHDQPVLDARLRNALADRYFDIGLGKRSLELHRQALKTLQRFLGEGHPDVLVGAYSVASRLRDEDQLGEAAAVLRPALDAALKGLGPDNAVTLRLSSEWASLLAAQGKRAEAEVAMRDAFRRQKAIVGPDDEWTLQTENNLNILLQDQGKLEEAEPLAREVLAVRRKTLGPGARETIVAVGNLGTLLQDSEKLEEAEVLYREVVASRRQQLGDEHPSTLVAMGNLGSCLRQEKKLEEAEMILRECVTGSRVALGSTHRDTLRNINSLGFVLLQMRRLDEGERCWRECVETGTRVLGPRHPETLVWTNNLAGLLRDRGAYAESEILYRQALVSFREVRGEKDFQTLSVRVGLGRTLVALKKFPEAEAELLPAEAAVAADPQLSRGLYKRIVATLSELYDGWQKVDPSHAADAARWKAKFAEQP